VNSDVSVTDYVTNSCHVTYGGGGLSPVSYSCEGARDYHAFQQQSAASSASMLGLAVQHHGAAQSSRPQQLLPVYDLDYPGHTVTSRRHLSAVPAPAAFLGVHPPCLTSQSLDDPHATPFRDQHRHSTATDHHLPGCIYRHPADDRLDVRHQKLDSTSRIVPAGNSAVDESTGDCLEKFDAPLRSSYDSRKSARHSSIGGGDVGHCTSPAGQQFHGVANVGHERSHNGVCYVPCRETATDQRQDNVVEREPATTDHDTPCARLRSTAAVADKSLADGRRSVSGGRRSAAGEEVFANERCESSKEKLNSDHAAHVNHPSSESKNAVSASNGQYVMTATR